VYSYGDDRYMIENPFGLFRLKRYILRDRILISIFGGSMNKALVVHPDILKYLGRSKLQLTIKNAKVRQLYISGKMCNTQYLQFDGSNRLYAFPNIETLQNLRLYVKKGLKFELKDGNPIYMHDIDNYQLGNILSSYHLWGDLQVLNIIKRVIEKEEESKLKYEDLYPIIDKLVAAYSKLKNKPTN
jgi:hypothetical protein